MPPMGEVVQRLLNARGEEVKTRVAAIKGGNTADLQAVIAAIDTLVADVHVGIDDALGQANPAS